jgi:hypothetical protein
MLHYGIRADNERVLCGMDQPGWLGTLQSDIRVVNIKSFMLCGLNWVVGYVTVGVIVMFSFSREIKKIESILSMEIIPCYGIKDSDILEKMAFDHYTIKVWLNVCLIVPLILIFVNIAYMVNTVKYNSHLVLQEQRGS